MDSMPGTRAAPTLRRSSDGSGAMPCARIVVSWAVAGSVAAGGLSLGVTALADPARVQDLLPLAPVLFVLGAGAGLVHGGILAYVGRPPTMTGRAAMAQTGVGVALAIPVLLVAWVATAWISLTAAVLTLRSPGTTVLTLIGWIAGIGACCWAALEGWRALARAFARWPESRPGSLLISGTLATLALLIVLHRAPLFHLTDFGALLLALAATLWVATPAVIVVLHFAHKWFAPLWGPPARP